jgi:hypothetical protein
LSKLAGIEREIELAVPAPVTVRAVLDALEAQYPVLRGTVRDHAGRSFGSSRAKKICRWSRPTRPCPKPW